MPEFFDAPAQTPDPAAFLPLVRREAQRRHRRNVALTCASVVALLAAAGVGTGRAISGGSGPSRSVQVVTTPTPTSTVTMAPTPMVKPPTPSLRPTAVGSTGAADRAAPPVDTGIKVYGDCRHATVEPIEIVEACADNGVGIKNVHWATWTSTRATGSGTLWYNDCNPNCASGHIHYVPNTAVTLTNPVSNANGQIVFSRILTNPEPPGYSTGPYRGSPQPMPTQPD